MIIRRPHGIRYLPGDSLVAVTSEQSGHVVIVNVTDGRIVRAVPTTQRGSHMVGIADDGVRAFTGNIGSNTVSELDLAQRNVRPHLGRPPLSRRRST